MKSRHTLRTLLFSVLLLVAIPLVAEQALPKLGESISFKHYQLFKLSDRTNIRDYDNQTDKYIISINRLLTEDIKKLPGAVVNYFSSVNSLKKKEVIFTNVIKPEYYYSSVWTDKNHIITLEKYTKTGSDSDISTYLGPLSKVKTSWHGDAIFSLKFKGDVLKFKGYAMRKIFSLKKLYWAYFEVYLPPEKYSDELKTLVLIANEPNNYLADNGLYILIPKL